MILTSFVKWDLTRLNDELFFSQDFIKWLYSPGRDVGLGLREEVIKPSCLRICFYLAIPSVLEINLHKSVQKLSLFVFGEFFNSIDNFGN